MGLKEELAKLEQEEETEVEERLSGIQESIYGLYRRIGVIVEYIDKQIKEDPMQQFETLRAKEMGLKNWHKNAKLNRRIRDSRRLREKNS